MAYFTPVNQVRLTNVATVRLKKGGTRFELACYPNKVLNWRDGVEKDLDEVLQTRNIFLNVSKGQVANNKQLEKCFGTTNEDEIIQVILKKGQVQVSEKERQHSRDNTFKDIATLVANKCVNPETRRPYPVTIIEKAMRDNHFSVHPTQGAKKQALEVMVLLQASIPIARAKMRVRVSLPGKEGKALKGKVTEMMQDVEREDFEAGTTEIIGLIEPGTFRALDEAIQAGTRGTGALDVLDTAVVEKGDETFE